MRIKFRQVFGTLFFSVMAVSCVQDVILDARDEPEVVVDCILTDEPVQILYLVYTKGASRETAPELPEAKAVLTDLTEGREVGRFQRTADGSWELAYAAIPTHSYRLEVSVPDHEPIWAEQTMPDAPGIKVGWHSWNPGDWSIPKAQWPPKDIDNNVGYTFQLNRPHDPVWFYGVNYPAMDSAGEQAEFLSTDSNLVDPFNEDAGWAFVEERNGTYLWGSEKSSAFRTTWYPALQDMPRHKRYLRFPVMEYTPDTPFYVSGSFRGYISDYKDFIHADVRPAELHYFSASSDYDLFLKDCYHLIDLKTSTDMADIFVRDNVYSNIHGAIGLFGAKIERALEWEGKETWQASGYFMLPRFVSSYTGGDANGNPHRYDDTVLKGKPFELLYYEYLRIRSGNPLPEWAPYYYNEYSGAKFHLDVIQDQAQLDAAGLGDLGAIDFSKKKVVVLAIGFTGEVPLLINYGSPYNKISSAPWPSGKRYPMILYANTSTTTDSSNPSSNEHYDSPFRCALLVDKDDIIADDNEILSSIMFCYHFSSLNRSLARSFAEGLAWNIQ